MPEELTEFQKKVTETIVTRGVNSDCEVCGKPQSTWSLSDQPVSIVLTNPEGSFSIPPPHIPTVAMICNNCGNVRFLALQALGLLDLIEGDEE